MTSYLSLVLLQIGFLCISKCYGVNTEGALTSYSLDKLPGAFDRSTVQIPLNNALFVVTKGQDKNCASGKNCLSLGKLTYSGHDILFFKLNSNDNNIIKDSFKVGLEQSGQIKVQFHHNGLWRNLVVSENGAKAVVEPVKENPANMGGDSSSSD